MIVYGDPRWETTLATLLGDLALRLEALAATPPALDDLRALLIFSGQVEQAVHDALGDGDPLVSDLARLTDELAQDVVAMYTGRQVGWRSAWSALDPAGYSAECLATTVEVRIPEGFAFYGLYPEQYVLAARRWLAEQDAAVERSALVVGIRSIGTTLAAVVAATLRAHGWSATRCTVRPSGHPWERQLPALPVDPGAAAVLLVDEGPGMSGSSFVAVAEAAVRAGVARERIAFFPSHSDEPGGAASEQVRAWWSSTPRYIASRAELRFDGLGLSEALAARSSALLDAHAPIVGVEDWGGGLWRGSVWPDPATWPAACAPFELPKYRCVAASGAAVVWKWAGLASEPGGPSAEVAVRQLGRQSAHGYCPPALDAAFGFIATPWIEGVALDQADPDVIDHIGQSIALLANPPLAEQEAIAARSRLDEMLYWNIWELLDEPAARAIRVWSRQVPLLHGPAYHDRQLAPHEWRRTPADALLKTDSTGHHYDHTAVGPQPLAWSLAGTMVEWHLDDTQAERLLQAYTRAGGEALPANALHLYRMAYAAFRAGQTALCASMTGDKAEQERLRTASSIYRDQLALLSSQR